jgi:3-hydroxyacyl-CoA dehydrogenase
VEMIAQLETSFTQLKRVPIFFYNIPTKAQTKVPGQDVFYFK